MTLALVPVAGGIGAGCRFALDGFARSRIAVAFPWGTMIINLSGSLLLGLLAGLAASGLPLEVQTIVGTGFVGGYTTFSTACVETLRLIQERRWAAVIGNGLGMLILATVAALIGMIIGRAL